LTVRLAEATASRELLFRELAAVLQQESNAKKIVIAQYNDQKRLYPFITHGYSPQESNELIAKFNEARAVDGEKAFSRAKNVAGLWPAGHGGSRCLFDRESGLGRCPQRRQHAAASAAGGRTRHGRCRP
jgi:hypothetical protein